MIVFLYIAKNFTFVKLVLSGSVKMFYSSQLSIISMPWHCLGTLDQSHLMNKAMKLVTQKHFNDFVLIRWA